jgi:hypothetical protein
VQFSHFGQYEPKFISRFQMRFIWVLHEVGMDAIDVPRQEPRARA